MRVRAVLLLATISLVCLLLLTLQFRGYGAGADDVLAFATTPIQAALARINRTAVGVWSTYEDWKSVRTENIRLREEARQLRIDALRVTEMAEENRRLRRLLALKEALPLATVSGEVIAHVNFLPYGSQEQLQACDAGTLRSVRYDKEGQTVTPLVG